MQRLSLLLVGSLTMLAGVSPLMAQNLPTAIKGAGEVAHMMEGGKVAINLPISNSQALKAVRDMRRLLVNANTQGAVLAQTPIVPAAKSNFRLGPTGPLQTGWATLVQTANLPKQAFQSTRTKAVKLTPTQTAELLLQENFKQEFDDLSPEQKEYVMLFNFPAVAVEGPTVVGKQQVERALATYQQIIENTPTILLRKDFFKHWGKLMSAVTNIGLFSTAESADLIITAASKVRSFRLQGPTDIIAVRALSNLKAYDKIQVLADIRSKKARDYAVEHNDNSIMIPYEWREIQKYMQENGLELNIDPRLIAPVQKKILSLRSRSEIWLGHYNPYNLFAADPSAQMTTNFLNLRKGIEQKVKDLALRQAIAQNFPSLKSTGSSPMVLTITTTTKPVEQQHTGSDLSKDMPIIFTHYGITPEETTVSPFK